MKRITRASINILSATLFLIGCGGLSFERDDKKPPALSNQYFQVEVEIKTNNIHVTITDLKRNIVWGEGFYLYELTERTDGGLKLISGLTLPKLNVQSDRIRIRGLLGNYEVEHDIIVTPGTHFFKETMAITNTRGVRGHLERFSTSFCKQIKGSDGNIEDNFLQDHFQAVPFLYRSEYPIPATPRYNDYSIEEIFEGDGFVFQTSEFTWDTPRRLPSRSFISEGWGWRRGDAILGIFSFNQDNMIFSSLTGDDMGNLRFGGFNKEGLNLSALERIEPSAKMYLGMNRFYYIEGDYNQIAYQYRNMLDEMGCRFPEDYNPPVHWNQLYNMRDAWTDRNTYSRNRILKEVQKAKDHSCQAIYLDPGWDTGFGSFIWGTDWLGESEDFIQMIENDYGLKTSLHTPMPPWASNVPHLMGPSAIESWPVSSRRMLRDGLGELIPAIKGPQICMGSRQYLDEAEKRLLKLCKAGAGFLMFDGTWWNGPCEDESHGHPVPYLYEDHINACVEMARRIHRTYPDVLIEMHDMLNGGHPTRSIPVYYKYGLPGSYDENWAFELWANPLDHIKDKNALAMYYYNLGCNVPLYVHVNTGFDNENSLGLWWFASTARHLGIGGDSPDPKVVENHHREMKRYIELQDFFKRGEFYGINEEIHIHSLTDRQSCVINIFNLSESESVTEGSITLKEIGLEPGKRYSSDKEWVSITSEKITVQKEMGAWDTDLAVIKPRY